LSKAKRSKAISMVRINKNQLSTLRHASIETIRTQAQEIVAKATSESTVFDADSLDKVPRFDLDGKLKMLLSS
jgi:hypothetical protein